MAFIPSPHTARIVVGFQGGGFDFSNVFWATKTDFTTQDMQDLGDAIQAAFVSSVKAGMSAGIRETGVTVYDARTDSGELTTSTTGADVGGAAGEALPVNLALIMTLRTAKRGRSYRGRTYVTLFREADIDSGVFGSGAVALAGTYIGAVKTAIEGEGWTMVIRSIQHNNVTTNPAVLTPVTSYESRSGVPGTQRRRLDRA